LLYSTSQQIKKISLRDPIKYTQIPPKPVMKNAEVQVNQFTDTAKIAKMIIGGELI